MKKVQKTIVQQLQNKISATKLNFWVKLVLNFSIRMGIKYIVRYAYEKSQAKDVDSLLIKLASGNYRSSLIEIPTVANNIIDIPKLTEQTEQKTFEALAGIINDITTEPEKQY